MSCDRTRLGSGGCQLSTPCVRFSEQKRKSPAFGQRSAQAHRTRAGLAVRGLWGAGAGAGGGELLQAAAYGPSRGAGGGRVCGAGAHW
jgi:hypothetical protein